MMSDLGLLPIIHACSGRTPEPTSRIGIGALILFADDVDLVEQVTQA